MSSRCPECGNALFNTDGRHHVCVFCLRNFKRMPKNQWKLTTEPHWLTRRRWFWTRDSGICGICGLSVSILETTIDHILPLSRGGADTNENKQIAHLECNQRKANRTDAEYAAFLPLDQIARST